MSAQPQEHDFRNPARPPAANEATIGTLLKELAHEVPALLSKEVELAKSEARESLQATKAAVAAIALGGVVATGGLVMLLLAGVYALSEVVDPWFAALIVGGIALAVGYGMIRAGKKKFDPGSLKPERTINSLREDKAALQGRAS